MEQTWRRTKIVATIGPATESPERMRALILAGMNVARINFSHGKAEDHVQVIKRVQDISRELDKPVAILQDLCGPKIRVQSMQNGAVELVAGRMATITTEQVEGTAERFSTSYEPLPRDVHSGAEILLDDGKLALVVESVSGSEVRCQVTRGGLLKSKKGMNLPNVRLSTPSVTEKDFADLRVGIAVGVDYVALSFVRAPEDIQQVKTALLEQQCDARVIAKIEMPEAIAKLDEIIQAADGVMIARGDLGVEMPPEQLPPLQKRIIKVCNNQDKPVIVATQMLESMMNSLQPNRAEVSDIANAIFDGADAVMLSGETAVGQYPCEAVGMMHKIALTAEAFIFKNWNSYTGDGGDFHILLDAIGRAAFRIVDDLKAPVLIVGSCTGETALYMSKSRTQAMVLAAAENDAVWRRASLYWGVVPVRGLAQQDTARDVYMTNAAASARDLGLGRTGEYAVVVCRTLCHSLDAKANAVVVVKL